MEPTKPDHQPSHAPIAQIFLYTLAFLALAAITKILDGAFQQVIEQYGESSNDRGIIHLIFFGSVSLVWILISSVLNLFLTAKAFGFRSNLRLRDFELLCIETLRAMAAASIRLPLFIVPAVYEWLRLMPVPYVVLFHKGYQTGDVDALIASRSFFRAYPARVIGLTSVALLFSAGLTLFDLSDGLAIPMIALGQFASNWLLLKIYLRSFTQLTAPPNSMSNSI